MTFQLSVERTPAHAQQPRGHRLVAAHLLQRADDVVALYLNQRRGRCRGPSVAWLQSRPTWSAAIADVVLQRVDRRVETLVSGRQNRFAVRAAVAERPKDVQTGHSGAHERQHRTVVVDHKKKTGTRILHSHSLQSGAHDRAPGLYIEQLGLQRATRQLTRLGVRA